MKYALTHCNILDGTEKMSLQKDMTVVIQEDKIISIDRNVDLSEGMTEIDLGGKYLLPGLINLHAHFAGSGKPKRMKRKPNLILLAEKHEFVRKSIQDSAKRNILTQLNSGVTTARSMGEIGHCDLHNRDMINQNTYIGPRVLGAGYGITGPRGHMAGAMAKECRTSNEAENVVAEEISKHVDWIKIFVTGGVADAESKDEQTSIKLPLEISQNVCEQAHKAGYKVAAHAQSTKGVRISLKAGADTIEHGARMDQEIIELYKKNKAAMIVTLSPAVANARLSSKILKTTSLQKTASESLLYEMIEGARQALKNQIPVGLGTDSGSPYIPQYDMWREIYYFWKYCGVSREYSIHTATLGNARILGIENETGSIEVGKLADLLVVSHNPLAKIENLRNVEMVVTKGRIISKPKIKRFSHLDKELDQLIE